MDKDLSQKRINNKNAKRFILSGIIIIAILALGIYTISTRWNNRKHITSTKEFVILEDNKEAEVEACYISVVYLNGYAYSPTEWIDEEGQDITKGEKLGEVTLDLKGLRYQGTPPDFSSTHDEGTEVYEIKGFKRERAVLMVDEDYEMVCYRSNKAVATPDAPINLTVSEVFHMMSDDTTVVSVELRSEEDGKWMRTSENAELIALINQELPERELLNSEELGPVKPSNRVPINVLFENGAAVHIQVYPEQRGAWMFGAYIRISEQLSKLITNLSTEGAVYPRITDLFSNSGSNSQIDYFAIYDIVDQREYLCAEAQWSGGAFYEFISRFMVSKMQSNPGGKQVMTFTLGEASEANRIINFYEVLDKALYVGVDGDYYEIKRDKLEYQDLKEFINNYTEFGED